MDGEGNDVTIVFITIAVVLAISLRVYVVGSPIDRPHSPPESFYLPGDDDDSSKASKP
jgi:hypothetical protein